MGAEQSTKQLGAHLIKMRNDEAYAQNEEAKKENLKKIFNEIDADNSGLIDQKECDQMWASFKKAFKSAADKEKALIKDLRVLDDFDFQQMEHLDYNKDGKFDFNEFYDMIEYMYNRLSAE
uniref:EF-hand domain-containing protein n=1 Tax=Vannella robusta TaxID=1487602 RepID=A0A7S4HZV3_9EUKA